LYIDLVVMSLSNADASVRATCLSVLRSLARAQDGDCVAHVSKTLPQLANMERDEPVEVRAQLIGLYCSLLAMLPAQSEAQELYQIVEALMADSDAVVQQAGVIALSQCVVPSLLSFPLFPALPLSLIACSCRRPHYGSHHHLLSFRGRGINPCWTCL
jgi:hypothetical protein